MVLKGFQKGRGSLGLRGKGQLDMRLPGKRTEKGIDGKSTNPQMGEQFSLQRVLSLSDAVPQPHSVARY
jgi:hypothetical protein